jgi:hypothetical protein
MSAVPGIGHRGFFLAAKRPEAMVLLGTKQFKHGGGKNDGAASARYRRRGKISLA